MASRNETLTAIRGVRVGHARDRRRPTGVTVVLFDRPVQSFADHRGGWPGGYDTVASNLGKTFVDRHAMFLTGGDIFGYDAGAGIREFLLEKGIAKKAGAGEMPMVMGTDIYDLIFGDMHEVDYGRLARRACEAASTRPVPQGNVGAGTGATVGPFYGLTGGTKGGLGSSAARLGRWTVGAIAVTNSVGNVFDPFEGRTIGGTRRRGGGFLEMDDVLQGYMKGVATRFGTTIGILGTDAPLDHEQLARLVELAHDGFALAVRPAHMSTDGDTILGFSTRRIPARRLDHRVFDALHHVAVQQIARATVNGVRAAGSLGGVPGCADGAVTAAAPRGSRSRTRAGA